MEKERTHYLNAMQRLRDAGEEVGAQALQAELERVDAEIADADYRAARHPGRVRVRDLQRRLVRRRQRGNRDDSSTRPDGPCP